jgi:LysM repeat protein
MSDDFDIRLKAQLQALAAAVPTSPAPTIQPAARPAAHGRVGRGSFRTRTALPIGSLAAVAVIVLAGIAIVPRLGSGGSTPSPTPDTGYFTPTGSMTTPRDGATATVLQDGRVLIAGGQNGAKYLASAELYDPASGRFTPTGSMVEPRTGHTATLLRDGRVLIVGGSINAPATASAELYDPTAGTFTATGSMAVARTDCTATLLADGRVLVAGGMGAARSSASPTSFSGSSDSAGDGGYLASAELYDPNTGTFAGTSAMTEPRAFHSATLLLDGRVLIAGGESGSGDPNNAGALATAELYDPATGRFQATGSMARHEFEPTLLTDGRVLFIEGSDEVGLSGAHAELFDPASGAFTGTGTMAIGSYSATAIRLADGRVLVVGGVHQDFAPPKAYMTKLLASAELFEPATGRFVPTGSMSTARIGATAVLLKDGRVLVAGGDASDSGPDPLASAEVYMPSNIAVAATAAVPGSVVLSPRVVLSFGTDNLTSTVLGPDGAAYVLDATAATVYRVDLHTGAKLPVVAAGQGAAGATVGTPRLLTTGGSDVLILDDSNSLWRWHPAPGDAAGRGALVQVNIPDSVNWAAGVRTIGTRLVDAGNDLYDLFVALPTLGQILEYGPASDGSGFTAPGQSLIDTTVDLSGIQDMYIDGNTYLVGSGAVTRYALGKAETRWSLSNPAAPPSTAPVYARLTADNPAQDQGNLYAYDSANRAVFAFAKKDGSYVAQYSVSSDTAWLSALAGMFVVPGSGTAKGTLYWVESGNLMGAALDGSAAPTSSASAAPTQSASAVAAPSVSMPSSAGSASAGSTYGIYAVIPGDSMQTIAIRFGVTFQALIEANPQVTDPSRLEVGWLLNIPPPASTGPS